MASTTLTTSSTPTASSQPHRASFSGGTATSLVPAPPLGAATNPSQTASNMSNMNPPHNGNNGNASQQSQHSQQSSQQSFSMSQPSSQISSSVYRQYTDPAPKPVNAGPVVFSATYSGVNVYEMNVGLANAASIAVMRRQDDDWLNATQILKVAGVEKGRRTKILEKEIQTGTHEKVQGGYGKYQGTWIPYERGLAVCRQYGVEGVLSTLLNHNRGNEGGVGDVDTPTKEQALAAQRKRMYTAGSQENRANGSAGTGTFFQKISSTASHALTAISKARFDSPAPRNRNGPTRAPSFQRQSSIQDGSDLPANSQQSFASDYGQNTESAFNSQTTQPLNGDGEQPPRKRQRVLTPANSFGGLTPTYPPMDSYAANFPGSPTEPNESFIYSQAGLNETEPVYSPGPLRPLPYETSPEGQEKRKMLMELFLPQFNGPNGPSEQSLDMLRNMIPQELDAPIDPQCCTSLHWAAALSRMPLLRALIEAGASPFRVNTSGETALMRACNVTNPMDANSFPELLDLLGSTIDVVDDKGRTVLHHIALTSAVKGRNMASRYYLESLLEWVVRAPSSQNAPSSSGINPPARMNIVRFMSEIVNAQDNSGDTALNIAARIGNRSIISQLLEVGADPNIANHAGLRPLDFGIGVENESQTNGEAKNGGNAGSQGSGHKSRENSDEVVNSITHLIGETTGLFQGELKKKQDAIDSLHNSLRTASAQIAETRHNVEALEAKLQAQQLMRQKVLNLARAAEEEEYNLVQIEQRHGRLDVAGANAWEVELDNAMSQQQQQANLPSAAVLRARINALRERTHQTRQATLEFKARSKDRELKYRKLVSLCTKCPEGEVDTLIDTLTRAVESEKGELEIGRVRRFLGGVEAVH